MTTDQEYDLHPYGDDAPHMTRHVEYEPAHDVTIDLLTQIRDTLRVISNDLSKMSAAADAFGQFASGPMSKSPLLKMLGLG